jgi:hypothetical protein
MSAKHGTLCRRAREGNQRGESKTVIGLLIRIMRQLRGLNPCEHGTQLVNVANRLKQHNVRNTGPRTVKSPETAERRELAERRSVEWKGGRVGQPNKRTDHTWLSMSYEESTNSEQASQGMFRKYISFAINRKFPVAKEMPRCAGTRSRAHTTASNSFVNVYLTDFIASR